MVILHFDDYRITKWRLEKEPKKKPDALPTITSRKSFCAPELPSNVSDLLPGYFVWLVGGVLRVRQSGHTSDLNHWGLKTRICEAIPAYLSRSRERVDFDARHVPGRYTVIRNREASTAPVLSRYLPLAQQAENPARAIERSAALMLSDPGHFLMAPSAPLDPSEIIDILPGQTAVYFADGRLARTLA